MQQIQPNLHSCRAARAAALRTQRTSSHRRRSQQVGRPQRACWHSGTERALRHTTPSHEQHRPRPLTPATRHKVPLVCAAAPRHAVAGRQLPAALRFVEQVGGFQGLGMGVAWLVWLHRSGRIH